MKKIIILAVAAVSVLTGVYINTINGIHEQYETQINDLTSTYETQIDELEAEIDNLVAENDTLSFKYHLATNESVKLSNEYTKLNSQMNELESQVWNVMNGEDYVVSMKYDGLNHEWTSTKDGLFTDKIHKVNCVTVKD